MGELIARLRALVRHDADCTSNVVAIGTLRLDTTRTSATFEGAPAKLPPSEFHLLDLFAHQSGRAVPVDDLA